MELRMSICGLINEAVSSGSSKDKACEETGYDIRTIQRWDKNLEGDKRKNRTTMPRMPCRQKNEKKLSPAAAKKGS